MFINFFISHPGVLFNWTLILYGTETDPLKGNLRINASLPTTQPMSRTPTTVTEATERRSKSLSGRCLLTGFGNGICPR